MAFDLQWDHQFCLACDKQTDGATYCSESCRLADFEKTASTSSSASSSPASTSPSSSWTFSKPTSSSTRFYLSPAYDFANAQPYGSTPTGSRRAAAFPQQQHHQRAQSSSLTPPARMLSPSSSHSSLCSVQSSASASSTASAADISQLSEKARRELQAYAISFAQVRLQRRRSY